MALRHTEQIKREKMQSWKLILGIILFMIIVNTVITFLNQMENGKLAGYMSIGIILLMILVNMRIMNHYLAEYEYTLNHKNFNINKTIGNRKKEVLSIPLENIDCIISSEQLKIDKSYKKKARKRYNLTLGRAEKHTVYRGYFKEEDKCKTFLFQPSKKMIECLKKELGNERVII